MPHARSVDSFVRATVSPASRIERTPPRQAWQHGRRVRRDGSTMPGNRRRRWSRRWQRSSIAQGRPRRQRPSWSKQRATGTALSVTGQLAFHDVEARCRVVAGVGAVESSVVVIPSANGGWELREPQANPVATASLGDGGRAISQPIEGARRAQAGPCQHNWRAILLPQGGCRNHDWDGDSDEVMARGRRAKRLSDGHGLVGENFRNRPPLIGFGRSHVHLAR